MGDVLVKWYGYEFKQKAKSQVRTNLRKAGNEFKKELKHVLSTPGRTVTYHTSKSGRTYKRLGKLGSAPSAPGSPPAKQSGRLWRSVFSRLSRTSDSIRVGARGFLMENKLNRPWLATTWARLKTELAQIAAGSNA